MKELENIAAEAVSQIQQLASGWTFCKAGENEWLPAVVPGCVHLDLIANKKIADPFYRDNEKELQWISESDWEYQIQFDIGASLFEKQHIELVFDGLDTYATIYLNGEKILEADNMFRPWQTDVKSLLKAKENTLRVLFGSPLNKEKEIVKGRTLPLYPAVNDQSAGTSPFTRKAPYHYGWDWGPCLVTAGIWRSVRLEGWDHYRILETQLKQTSLNDKLAKVDFEIKVWTLEDTSASLGALLDDEYLPQTKNVNLSRGNNTLSYTFDIQNPQRWWPRGYGKAHLYSLALELSVKNEVQRCTKKIGLRTIKLKREKDDAGEGFAFRVNGVPVFAKGANWIPADSFTTRMGTAWYRDLLQSAVDANMNMMRIWGGGIYETETFYDLCDELGLLVWQDFMFACSLYPGDDKFLASVEAEARYQVRRLRHRACIALWCGNNEVEAAWKGWGWKEKYPASFWDEYDALFHQLLPKVCAEEDPSRAYWPSSPTSHPKGEGDPNSSDYGDEHYWGVWHAEEPFESYQQKTSRFMSEYGFQSFPELATVNTYTEESDHDILSPVMQAHQRSGKGNHLIKHYMKNYYHLPKKFENFLLLSQAQQAHGIKMGTEHFRRLMPHCMGSLYWQLNDCWPVASWASIDYFGRWKALHYYARRFYAPLLLSPAKDDAGDIAIYAVSDLRKIVQGTLVASLYHLSGEKLYEVRKEVIIQPLTSAVYHTFTKNKIPSSVDFSQTVLHCVLEQSGDSIAENTFHFVHPISQQLFSPELSIEIEKIGEKFKISASAPMIVRDLMFTANGIEGRFQENYVDLLPGVIREIIFTPAQSCLETAFRSALKWHSLFEMMECKA